jgi:hypothetical protein
MPITEREKSNEVSSEVASEVEQAIREKKTLRSLVSFIAP